MDETVICEISPLVSYAGEVGDIVWMAGFIVWMAEVFIVWVAGFIRWQV